MSADTAAILRPRVYISYTWRTPKLRKKGLWLADRLRDSGVDSRIDLYYGKSLHGFTPPPPLPDRDAWDYWQEEQIKLADRVIVFCTQEYASALPTSGVARDLRYIQSDLKTSPDALKKLIPVGLGTFEENASYIPDFMRGATYYDIGSPQRGMFGLADLIRRLQTEFPPSAPASQTAVPFKVDSGRITPKGRVSMTPASLQASDLKGKIHAAIMTIRTDEYEEMEAKLGEVRPVSGKNSYKYAELTSEDGRPISVVLTRVVGQGNTKAQAVASRIINELDPAWIILVGIAGGVPDNEFSLGDVVLATYLHDFSLTAATEQGVTRQSAGGDMHQDVERFLSTRAIGGDGKRLKELAGFNTDSELASHPVVYPATIPKGKRFYGSPSFQKKVERSIDVRFPNGKRNGGPKIAQGPCANGNVLLKSGTLLEKWQESARHIVQVEMELAGVYEAARTAGRENYPVLAVRGLSDIIGFSRDPNWTGYACKTAAAFTSALLKSGFIDFAKNLPPLPKDTQQASAAEMDDDINRRVDKPQSKLARQRNKSRSELRNDPEGHASDVKPTALKIWIEKLEYLQEQEAVSSDPAQKFALRKLIEEARAKIRELGN